MDLQIRNLIQSPCEIKEVINNVNADIFILGGDIIDQSSDLPKLKDYLSNLDIKYKYYVRGNHEYTLDESQSKEIEGTLKELGFKDINNTNVSFKGFNIIGIDDITKRKDNIEKGYTNLDISNEFNLVVTHNHDINYKLDDNGYNANLILTGHTHGGQVVIPLKSIKKITRLWEEKGFYKGEYYFKGKNKTYRNYTVNGLGGSKTPLRINAQQEMLLIKINNCE